MTSTILAFIAAAQIIIGPSPMLSGGTVIRSQRFIAYADASAVPGLYRIVVNDVALVRSYRLVEDRVEFVFPNGLKPQGVYTLRIELVADDGSLWSTAPFTLTVTPRFAAPGKADAP